jgi:hypothetical protein
MVRKGRVEVRLDVREVITEAERRHGPSTAPKLPLPFGGNAALPTLFPALA